MQILKINSRQREEMLDITPLIREKADIRADCGAIMLFCPHTTCGLTINEGADPDVKADLMRFFQEIAPYEHGWAHREGNTDAHIRASLLGASLLLPVMDSRIMLGTWQSVYLYEGDGPRERTIWMQFLNSAD